LALPAALQGSVEFFTDGRSAVAAAFAGLPLCSGDEVLFPIYHCGSEFEELVQCGLVPRWYSLDARLEVRIETLEAARTAVTRAVYVIHYLGWPQAMAPIAEFCRRHSLLLIEDCAQALYSRDGSAPVGGHADCAIFSLHKFLPLTDGGVLRWNHAAPKPKARPAGGQARELDQRKRARRALAAPGMPATWLALSEAAVRVWQALLARANRRLRRHPPASAPADEQPAAADAPFAAQPDSIDALMRIDHDAVIAKRRQNGRRLHALFEARPGATPVFPSDTDGYVPLVFAVHIYNPEPLLAELAACGIEAGLHWSSVDTRVPYAEHAQVVRLKTHLVVLPVHQDMTADDFERIERAAAAALPEPREPREVGVAGNMVQAPIAVAQVQ
jgi:dTDP-4-amino-4,6-dideoxygalactose transaminase